MSDFKIKLIVYGSLFVVTAILVIISVDLYNWARYQDVTAIVSGRVTKTSTSSSTVNVPIIGPNSTTYIPTSEDSFYALVQEQDGPLQPVRFENMGDYMQVDVGDICEFRLDFFGGVGSFSCHKG